MIHTYPFYLYYQNETKSANILNNKLKYAKLALWIRHIQHKL